jgi:hypothetical protein
MQILVIPNDEKTMQDKNVQIMTIKNNKGSGAAKKIIFVILLLLSTAFCQFNSKDSAVATAAAMSTVMNDSGIVYVEGGAHFISRTSSIHNVILVVPQLSDAQIPICFNITADPADSLIEYRLEQRNKSNVIVNLTLQGSKDKEILINWSSYVLVINNEK